MTKKELHLTTLAAVIAFAKENRLPENVQTGLTDILGNHLAPKVGGATVNIDEVTRKNEKGQITEVLCAMSNVWLPATSEFFYEDKSENPRIVGLDGKGLKRQSKQAESISKQFNKTKKATVQAITDDILSLTDSAEDLAKSKTLKAQLIREKAKTADFSTVTAKPVAPVAEPVA